MSSTRHEQAAVSPTHAAPASTGNRRALLVALIGMPLLAVLLLSAFGWPTARLAPRDVPIGVAGPDPAAAAVRDQLAGQDGAFSISVYAAAAAAEAAIAERDIYGAVVVTADGPQVLTASAGSPAVAQILGELARGMSDEQGAVPVRDVVAADPDDPRGGALAITVLPMVILGIATGAIAVLEGEGSLGRLGVIAVGAVMIGLTAGALIQGWLGVIDGDWWTNAGVLALIVAAIAATVAGLGSLLGQAGIGLGALLMVLLGNPLSGAASAPELLPQPWGAIGQVLPPGAGITLLRSTSFFDGAGAAGPPWILLSWLVAGCALVAAAGLRARRQAPSGRPVAAN
ncbi:MAG: hypothetical protein ACR2JO_04875 [Mycobacteriales bacterium]